MKVPLQYQITEFDCGRASLINALLFLMDREEIRPETLHLIERVTMDNVDEDCKFGYCGTSEAGFRYFANRMRHYHERTGFAIDCEMIAGGDVSMENGSRLLSALGDGCVAVCCLLDEGDLHYALLNGLHAAQPGDRFSACAGADYEPHKFACPANRFTAGTGAGAAGLCSGERKTDSRPRAGSASQQLYVDMFDPYYENPECYLDPRVEVIEGNPTVNRRVRRDVFDDGQAQNYTLAGYDKRFALLLWRTDL